MKIKLFCIPYAGGTASFFNTWQPYLDPIVDIRPIELAGKGKRLMEPLYQNMPEAVQDVLQILLEEIDEGPYMIYGHSMGGKIAYKLMQEIERANLPKPLHIFISGSGAPHFKRKEDELYHLMDDAVFREKIIALGGTPPAFFDSPELVEIFIPALKNDFKIVETAVYEDPIEQVKCDLSVFIGKEDDLSLAEREGWKHYTHQSCQFHYFEGGHFFIHDKIDSLSKLINQVVSKHTIFK